MRRRKERSDEDANEAWTDDSGRVEVLHRQEKKRPLLCSQDSPLSN
jgi:hypothetical protein